MGRRKPSRDLRWEVGKRGADVEEKQVHNCNLSPNAPSLTPPSNRPSLDGLPQNRQSFSNLSFHQPSFSQRHLHQSSLTKKLPFLNKQLPNRSSFSTAPPRMKISCRYRRVRRLLSWDIW